jgi:diguanylate cyclase (GGDEF)-like protein/PAS domain S-box-containing protein
MFYRPTLREQVLTAAAEAVGLLGALEPHRRIPQALARLGQGLEAEWVALFEGGTRGEAFEAGHVWLGREQNPPPHRLSPDHPWLEPLAQGQILWPRGPDWPLGIPVMLEGRLGAFLALRLAQEAGWGEEGLGPLRLLAAALSEASQRQRLEQALHQSEARYGELTLLSSVLGALAADLEPQSLFRRVVEAVSGSLGGAMTCLYLLEGQELVPQHQVGYPRGLERVPLEKGVIGRAARSGEAQLVGDPSADPDLTGGVASAMVIPVRIAGEVRGVLAVESFSEVFSQADLERLQKLAAPLGLVLERVRLFQSLRESERRYRSLFEGMPIGLYRASLDGHFLDGNPALVQMLGLEGPEELRRHNIEHFCSAPLERYLQGGVQITETELVRKDGQRLWVQEVRQLIHDDEGQPLYFEGSLQDISERKAYQAQVERLAYYDPLTALPNRLLLQERAEQALARARRTQQSVILAYLDLDRFKEINDTLGHKVGDELLRLVADRIRGLSREADTQARLGGDEFALLLCDTDEHGAVRVVSRLLEALKQPFVVGGETVYLRVSIGLATHPRDGEDLDALTRAADVAMYQAKAEGGGFRFYNPTQNRYTRQRLSTLQGLRRALGQGELVLYYQPVLDLKTQTLRRMEALVRWQDPERGMVPPHEFVPLAEESGIIQELDLFVLEQALREAHTHGLEFSLNLSARNFHDPHFVDLAAGLLQRYPLDRGRLWLEITETALMLEREKAVYNLQALRNLGARIALDDFGMGYSSLAYLKHLPVDLLKLDKQFVAGIGSPRDEAILRSMISLGHSLGLEVLAEGVETPHQLAWLREAGCDLAQGYYVGMPSPSAEGGFVFTAPPVPEP